MTIVPHLLLRAHLRGAEIDRKVALKWLRPEVPAEAEAARLRLVREAQLIRHPNVIVEDDRVFIAMGLVEGVGSELDAAGARGVAAARD